MLKESMMFKNIVKIIKENNDFGEEIQVPDWNIMEGQKEILVYALAWLSNEKSNVRSAREWKDLIYKMDEMLNNWKRKESSVTFSEMVEISTDEERCSSADQVGEIIEEEEGFKKRKKE